MSNERLVKINTPLGEDLLLSSMSASESIGAAFRYDLTLRSAKEDIDPNKLLGQTASVAVAMEDGSDRYFHGYISHFSQQGRTTGGYATYSMVLQPWLWLMSRTSDCRIFQEMTVPDILKEVFADNGFSDYELNLNESYRTWEYCVQYRETDFNFVSRLLEQEGIYYFFKHESSKHTLVLADGYSSHSPIEGDDTIPYHLTGTGLNSESRTVSSWQTNFELQPGNYALTDYDFKKPQSDLAANRAISRKHSESEREIFDYPGEYVEASDGDQYALARIEELQVGHAQVSGQTDAVAMATGGLFTLKDHPRGDQNKEYLVIGANYEVQATDYESAGSGGDSFDCSFTAIEAKTPFRTSRNTPKPAVQGPQTAVVVGPSGKEIYCDEYGRIKVQFHWDRYGKYDENSSCWIRVAQFWGGPGFGAQFLPRIGHEVMVEFLEGDPDRPIITGRVYNADNMPPYTLPSNETQSGIKSRSTPDGTTSNFNEIRMEDKKGSEELFIQAEKDENINVKNNKTEAVGNNETITIGSNRTESIGANETLSVGENRTRSVEGDESISVEKNRTASIAKNESISIGSSQTQSIAKDSEITIGKDHSLSIGEKRSTQVGKEDELQVGKKLVIDVGDQITIKTGKASITMKKDGTITIEGKNITSKGSGAINMKASKDIVMKGKKILQN